MKIGYAEANGNLYMTDGFGHVQRWDGVSPFAVDAGVDAPSTALTIASSGRGTIAGTYTAYSRFIDSQNNYSNLSPISNELDSFVAGGNVSGATTTTPIVITTSAAHGLATGDIVRIEDVSGNTSANGDWTVTVLTSTTFSLDNSTGAGTYTGNGTWSSGADTITYTSVPVPTDTKVTIRQILRNTALQADTYYVDVETTDLVTTTFQSTRDDEELSTQEAQDLFDELGEELADSHDRPPKTKIAMVHHLDRMHYFGEEDYTAGSIKVTTSSTTVTGVGTDWNDSLEGRYLYVNSSQRSYAIASVTDATHLELASIYLESSDKFATYAIRSSTYQLKQSLFSEAGLPESVPPRNVLQIRHNGDRIRGGYASGPYLYILEDRHIHRAVIGADPLRDGDIYPGAERGVLNHRCFVVNEGKAYCLDEQGCHVSDDNGTQSISNPIQDLFRKHSRSRWRMNWTQRDHFHAVLHEQQDTVRWFVVLAGCSRPKHSIAYNFRLQRWWIEEWPRPITASCVGRIADQPVIFLGSDAKQVFALDQGFQDFVDSRGAGTKRGTATSATITTLTDTTAEFESTVVGATLYIVDGTGRGQQRRIVERTATVLTLQYPWRVLPDETSVYQIGGVKWRWRPKKFRLPEDARNSPTGYEIVFQPLQSETTMELQVYQDVSRTGTPLGHSKSSQAGGGIRVDKGDPRATIELSGENVSRGIVSDRLDRHLVRAVEGARFASVELSGVTNAEQVIIYELVLDGME